MKIVKLRNWIALLSIILIISACNYPTAKAPTPFPFPTIELTQTAEALQGTNPAPVPTILSTSTPIPETGAGATATATPTANISPSNTTNPPATRSRGQVQASYLSSAPVIDANLGDWNLPAYPVNHVVFGQDKWNGDADLSAMVMFGWDNNFLYIAGHVRDNRYVQDASGYNLYKGDSLELLFDKNLGGDYNVQSLSPDDFQLGISPGSPTPGSQPNAYLWFPANTEGPRPEVKIAAKATADGYDFETAIPWAVFDTTPQAGLHYGFAFSVSDDDKPDSQIQQKMVSTDPDRALTDPTTWGDLELVKP